MEKNNLPPDGEITENSLLTLTKRPGLLFYMDVPILKTVVFLCSLKSISPVLVEEIYPPKMAYCNVYDMNNLFDIKQKIFCKLVTF